MYIDYANLSERIYAENLSHGRCDETESCLITKLIAVVNILSNLSDGFIFPASDNKLTEYPVPLVNYATMVTCVMDYMGRLADLYPVQWGQFWIMLDNNGIDDLHIEASENIEHTIFENDSNTPTHRAGQFVVLENIANMNEFLRYYYHRINKDNLQSDKTDYPSLVNILMSMFYCLVETVVIIEELAKRQGFNNLWTVVAKMFEYNNGKLIQLTR